MSEGRILHAISGFYYVETPEGVLECKAKGAFRKEKLTPLVGDLVTVTASRETGKAVVSGIKERKNFLLRPPVANLDRLFIVVSSARPKPNIYVLDKLTAISVFHGITPILVFSKADLSDTAALQHVYREAGFEVVQCSAVTGEGMDRIASLAQTGVSAFTGNSGVGKSTLINLLHPELRLETNEISDKLGRGKHTTRSVRLYPHEEGYLADTPGFSSIDMEQDGAEIPKEALWECFPEFREYALSCRFYPSCTHVCDKGCAVLQALGSGMIDRGRHESYSKMYQELKSMKPRY